MVLIHDFICIERPVPDVVALLETKETWLVPLAASAYQEGEALLGGDRPVGPGVVTKRVHMTVGSSRSRADSLVVPIHWEATGLRGLFPVLEADLEFAPLGGGATQLSLWGSYSPPLDGLGARLDRLVFHRIAEATVRSFLDSVAGAIEQAAPVESTAPDPSGP
jgi:hypothetical protein